MFAKVRRKIEGLKHGTLWKVNQRERRFRSQKSELPCKPSVAPTNLEDAAGAVESLLRRTDNSTRDEAQHQVVVVQVPSVAVG
jgi:hypothetical protein